ncbi:hypothetical protein KY285_007923 [Solanum tuberosum]|nr:hypothetical protein KY285_007923 [Solanum tuberosum]
MGPPLYPSPLKYRASLCMVWGLNLRPKPQILLLLPLELGLGGWPIPINVKELRGFLGLTSYYRRFVKGYGMMARPLTELTKKNAFQWSNSAENAFQLLKQALTTVMECDASSEGIGAILLQDDHPIAYFSKGLSFSSRLKSTYDRKLLALVLALQKWKHYLLGNHFYVRTDHCSLKYLLSQRITTNEQQRLLMKLLPFNFTIVYKAGKDNLGADSLSRRPLNADFLALAIPVPMDFSNWQNALQADTYTREIIQAIHHDPSLQLDFHLVDQKLYFKERLVVPDQSSIRQKLLSESHDTPTAGHGGYLKTLKRLSSNFFWPRMKHDVKIFVQNCLVCQQAKYQALAPTGLLQPLPIPERIWEDVSLDFIVGLPKSGGFDTILVVVDRLSKYSHFIPLSHPYTAKIVAKVFCKEIVRLHGIPRSILSDRDVIFLSAFWQELFRFSQTRLRMGTSYHPQSDGQTEVVNRCLESYLRCFVMEQPHTWSQYLPWAEFSFNTSFHSSTETTPFKVVYGRDPLSISPYVHGETRIAELEEQLLNRDAMLKILKDNLLKAQTRMKQQANSHRRDVTFQVLKILKDNLLKAQTRMKQQANSHRRDVTFKLTCSALSSTFFGSSQLPASSKVHPIFHVSLLRPAHGQQAVIPPAPLPLNEDWELTISPAKILAHRWVKEAGSSSWNYSFTGLTVRLKKLVGKTMIYLQISFLLIALRTRQLFREDALIRMLL